MITNYIILTDPDDKKKMFFVKKEIVVCLYSPSKNKCGLMLKDGKRFVFADSYEEVKKLLFRENADDDRKDQWIECIDEDGDYSLVSKSIITAVFEVKTGAVIKVNVSAVTNNPLFTLAGKTQDAIGTCEKFEDVIAKLINSETVH